MNVAIAAEILLEAQHAQRALYTFTVSIKKINELSLIHSISSPIFSSSKHFTKRFFMVSEP